MATGWSSKADGKTIFYKLPEHLAIYHKKWVDRRNISQSIVASEPQRQPHTHRIQSEHHIAYVLDPALHNQPGVMSISHAAVASPQAAHDLAQNALGPSTSANMSSAIIPLDDQHSVLQGMGQGMTFMNREPNLQLASNYMAVAPGSTFIPSKMSLNQLQINQPQIITQAVNQSWTVYDPNAELIAGCGR